MDSKNDEMQLIPKRIVDRLQPLEEKDHLDMEKIKVPLKLFNPLGSETWYIFQYDQEKDLAYGLIDTGNHYEAELGYIDIGELKNKELPLGLGIDRDINWDPEITLHQVVTTVKSGKYM